MKKMSLQLLPAILNHVCFFLQFLHILSSYKIINSSKEYKVSRTENGFLCFKYLFLVRCVDFNEDAYMIRIKATITITTAKGLNPFQRIKLFRFLFLPHNVEHFLNAKYIQDIQFYSLQQTNLNIIILSHDYNSVIT